MHTEVLSYEADGVLMQSHLYFEGDARDFGFFLKRLGLTSTPKRKPND